MKLLIAIFLLLSLDATAQDTCGLKKTTDPFTHVTKLTTGFVSFPVNGIPLSISVDATKTEVDIFLWINNGSCFDESSDAQLLFDGERLRASYKNTGSMNCEGAFHITFRNTVNTPSNLKRLTDKKLKSIKITGNGGAITEISFTDEQKAKLMRMTSCVVTQAKSLL